MYTATRRPKKKIRRHPFGRGNLLITLGILLLLGAAGLTLANIAEENSAAAYSEDSLSGLITAIEGVRATPAPDTEDPALIGDLLPDGAIVCAQGVRGEDGSTVYPPAVVCLPDGTVRFLAVTVSSDGECAYTQGDITSAGVLLPDGAVICAEASALADGAVAYVPGLVLFPDGNTQFVTAVVTASGEVRYSPADPEAVAARLPDGAIVCTHGTVQADGSIAFAPGTVILPDGSRKPLRALVDLDGNVVYTVWAPPQATAIPDYILNPNMNMPYMTLDSEKYIGILTLPTLNLQLPIMSEWSYPHLKKSPCRYSGSAYKDDLIICAHNYDRHFGQIKTLQPDDPVYFTDLDGNDFTYRVIDTEILQPNEVSVLKSGEWDMTLFTCTIGGATRVTVRLERTE